MADDNNMNHDILSLSNNNHTMVPTDDDFITELTHQMSQFMLQEDVDDSFDFSSIASQSHDSELSWDLISSPDSTLWSPVSCNQGSSEGSSLDSSPPATPCWKTKTYANVVKGFQNNTMKHNEKAIYKQNHGSVIQTQSVKSSNVDRFSSHKALIEEQIKSIEARKKHYISDIMQQQQQQHALSQKQQNEAKEKEINGRNCIRPRPRPHLPRLAPLQTVGGGMMQAVFLGGSGSRSGTGVFLPHAGTVVAPSESTKRKGKGCSTVLIPARVVQALQLHFDKTAPKVVGVPPLRDLVLNHREGMFSLENHQSTKAATDVQNDMILPQEWTY